MGQDIDKDRNFGGDVKVSRELEMSQFDCQGLSLVLIEIKDLLNDIMPG